MITPHWQHFEHKADMGVRGFGNELTEASEQAGLSRKIAKLEPLICIKG